MKKVKVLFLLILSSLAMIGSVGLSKTDSVGAYSGTVKYFTTCVRASNATAVAGAVITNAGWLEDITCNKRPQGKTAIVTIYYGFSLGTGYGTVKSYVIR